MNKKIFKKINYKKNKRKILIVIFVLSLTSSFYLFIALKQNNEAYKLADAKSLLTQPNNVTASKIKFDEKEKSYNFDNEKNNKNSETIQTGATKVISKIYQEPEKGVEVTDSNNKISFNLTPLYKLKKGQKNDNYIIFPFSNNSGWTVYTVQNTGIKEDIILKEKTKDLMEFEYKFNLKSGLEPKIESDGSIGIYGDSILSGDIATGSEKDIELLQKARENVQKNTLMFTIPRPIIIESNGNKSNASVKYQLKNDRLIIIAKNLKSARYPITIDPSIYVASAQKFMNGNNETNINFNIDDQLIEKSHTTGARFDEWNQTKPLTTASWGSGNVAAGGFIYSIGGTSFSGKILNTQGAGSYTVPSGVTSLKIKMWGAGGGGGGAGYSANGGAGGGGGYTEATISVTPGETLTTYVGGGGDGGIYHSGGNDAGYGGAGGGFSSLYRGSTPLLVAAGGGGGGGARYNLNGGAGGAGGGTSGLAGSTVGYGIGGGGGSSGSGGTGGVNSSGNDGAKGSSLAGGAGADGRTNDGNDGSGATGGLASGGNGGQANINTTRAGGGGGGAGHYGGGGGAASRNNNSDAGGGGGGASSYIIANASAKQNLSGTGTNPGNSSESARNNAGNGGSGGSSRGSGNSGANGLIMITYGSGESVSSSVNWAKFNTNDGSIESANPGNGVCSGWCTTTEYDLPEARTNLSLVTYNGFLYAIGGKDSSGNNKNSIYIAKIGANGEPQLWHPTDSNKANWKYWYQDNNLNTALSDFSTVAYNNRLYIIGGMSDSGPVNTVSYADITATGKLSPLVTGTNLPYNLYGHSSQVYNDKLYIIGGANSLSGAPLNNVYYNILNSDGSLNNWIQTTSMSSGRLSNGGNFSVVWGAYIYTSGGCNSTNSSGFCTNILSDTQVASINADGSVGAWNTVGGVSSQRTSSGLIAWQNSIYEIGGCSSQNATTGDCNSGTLDSIIYGNINQDGDASTVAESVSPGTGSCSGSNPYNCNLPGTSYVGNMLSSTIITNGYLYVIGGCTNNACSTTSGNVAYAAISSTGQIEKPATCPNGTYRGSIWCVDATNIITGGIAAASPDVFNNILYLVGGLSGSSNKNAIYRTVLSSDGSISSWSSQTMTSLGVNSVSYSYAFTRANPSSAGTYPGNLFILGGCTSSSAAGCTAYSPSVYKCNIQTSGLISNCSTSGQLQIGTLPDDSSPGLGIMSGTVYANYIYLIGGVSPNLVDITTLRYAKIDNNNNIVAVSGNTWIQSDKEMLVGRRRASAFGYNGYIYVVGGYDATEGVLADIEFVKMNVSDGSLGDDRNGFKVSAVTINQRWGLSVPISNSYAYVIGGCIAGDSPSGCTNRTDVVQTFQIYNNDSGAPAEYKTANNTYTNDPNRIGASSTILNGYIYTAGGCISATDCTTATNNVSYAKIDVNGNIGGWNSTASLPNARAWGQLETVGNSLYYIGGQSNNSSDRRSEVYYATPSGGDISSWSNASNNLPSARTKFGATVWNNRIYIAGGEGTGSGCNSYNACSNTYISPPLNNGGDINSNWQNGTSFNVARSGATLVSYANNLYLLGGFDGVNYLSDSQYSQISANNGLSGDWSFSTSLPGPISQADGFAANGYIYLMGGRSGTTSCTSKTLVAPISANTTIASGNNPTGIGAWYQTNQKYIGDRYGNSALYNEGKAYIIGGACGNTLTYASPSIQQTTLLSQPQVAKYSIMIDTDSDTFPSYWLLNGVDNSIGAKWKLKYRSMTNTTTACTSSPMITWGQETLFGDVTLGLPSTYNPLDDNGNNTNCTRFYYFNVTVDSSKAFGYPDDVTRGPTITDLTLQFTADPSKRLMHGRTFTGGLQQPLDTPIYSQ